MTYALFALSVLVFLAAWAYNLDGDTMRGDLLTVASAVLFSAGCITSRLDRLIGKVRKSHTRH